MHRLARATVLAVLLAAAPRAGAAGASAAVEDVPDEVTISGERSGPRLWKVSHEDHVLWVLGTIEPLPKQMSWRSAAVEEAIAESAQVLLPGGLSISAGPFTAFRLYRQWRRTLKPADGTKLRESLPPPLYARYLAAKARFAPHSSSTEELRPIFAAQRLYWASESAADLSTRHLVVKEVTRLAKRHDVELKSIMLKIDGSSGTVSQVMTDFGAITRSSELACFEATLRQVEDGLATSKAAARAWAEGDVATLRTLPWRDQESQCWDPVLATGTLGNLNAQLAQMWLDAVVAALGANRSSFAVYSMPDLLKADGLLAALRARGYRVEGP
jgi:hypothetical protein